ncbi:MAG TPA: hypothetical protein VEC60_04055 [Reyranella sp.]|nr:hypothetical protein [Reyranella sp.]
MLAACVGVPLAPPDRDAAAKRFDPPRPGLAALYVVREGSFVTAPLAVLVDQRPAGALGHDSYLRVELAPGWHDVRARDLDTGRQLAATNIQLDVGDIRFVSLANAVLETPLTSTMTEVSAREVPAPQGRAAVASRRLAASREL